MGIKVIELEKNLIKAESSNRLVIKDYVMRPVLTARFEYQKKDDIVLYNSLDFLLMVLESTHNSNTVPGFNLKRKFATSLSDSSLIDKDNLSAFTNILSTDFAYVDNGVGMLLMPQELHSIYMPLLKEINSYIKQ